MLIRWTPFAVDVLKAISRRIERDRSLGAANRVCRSIYDVTQTLRHHPYSGRVGMEEGTRELVIPGLPYVVTYRVTSSNAIQILRIWHGAQNRQ